MIYQLPKIQTEKPIVEVTDLSFFVREVVRAKVLVLAFFFTEWSGSCRSLNPLLTEIAADHPALLKVVKVNADRNPGVAARYSIHSVPTLVCFSGGEETARRIGRDSVQALLSELTMTTYTLDAHAVARE